MSTNSVVIKTGIFTEWFQPHLIPQVMAVLKGTALMHVQVVHVHSVQAGLLGSRRHSCFVSGRKATAHKRVMLI
jgi:hypothetical protein